MPVAPHFAVLERRGSVRAHTASSIQITEGVQLIEQRGGELTLSLLKGQLLLPT